MIVSSWYLPRIAVFTWKKYMHNVSLIMRNEKKSEVSLDRSYETSFLIFKNQSLSLLGMIFCQSDQTLHRGIEMLMLAVDDMIVVVKGKLGQFDDAQLVLGNLFLNHRFR